MIGVQDSKIWKHQLSGWRVAWAMDGELGPGDADTHVHAMRLLQMPIWRKGSGHVDAAFGPALSPTSSADLVVVHKCSFVFLDFTLRMRHKLGGFFYYIKKSQVPAL